MFLNLLYTLYRYLNPANLEVIQKGFSFFSIMLISDLGSSSKFVYCLDM